MVGKVREAITRSHVLIGLLFVFTSTLLPASGFSPQDLTNLFLVAVLEERSFPVLL